MKNISLILPNRLLTGSFKASYVLYDRAGGSMKRRAASFRDEVFLNSAILSDCAKHPTAQRLHLEIEGYLTLDLALATAPAPASATDLPLG